MVDPSAGPRFATEPIELLSAVVSSIEPALTASTIAQVVMEVTPTRARQRDLARALDAQPELLTSGQPLGPRSIERFIRALRAAGATHVTPPRCAGCDKPAALVNVDRDHRRTCASCFNKSRRVRQVCAQCGRHRIVGFHAPDGTPRCRLCPPEPDRDHAGDICGHLQRVTGQADQALLRGLVEQAIPMAHQRREVARELDEHPDRLTEQAAAGSARLVALLELLARREIPGFQPLRCPFCSRETRLSRSSREGLRCCRRCYDLAKLTTCCGCGRDRPVASRTPDGQPQCTNCHRYDPINQEQCSNCGRIGVICHRDARRALCKRCWRGYEANCSICGKRKPCYFASTDRPRCLTCSRNLLNSYPCVRCGKVRPIFMRDANGGSVCDNCARRRETCCRCQRVMPTYRTIAAGPLCGTCHKTEPACFEHCTRCGAFERLHHFGLCQRCACPPLLRQALAGPHERVRSELEPVIHVLLASEPEPLLKWLRSPGTRTMMSELATMPGPVTHDVLDQIGPPRTAKRLRDILVAAKFLPDRDEYLATLERWLSDMLETIEDPAEQRLVRSYATWTRLRRLRNQSPITAGQPSELKKEVRNVIALLAWLRKSGSSLASCTQTDIDTWITTGNTPRLAIRGFLAWAAQHGPAHDVSAPSRMRRGECAGFAEADRRWTLAHRLLHDDQIATHDRVAGLLVLFYAQPPSRIVALTTRHVTSENETVSLKLGATPIDLPAPLDGLVLDLTRDRRGFAALGHTDDHPWLFPGGSPGRHLSSPQLAKRLRRLDIPARIARNSALLDLASELPPSVLSQLLGLDLNTADHWATVAGNTNQGYAADLARQRT